MNYVQRRGEVRDVKIRLQFQAPKGGLGQRRYTSIKGAWRFEKGLAPETENIVAKKIRKRCE